MTKLTNKTYMNQYNVEAVLSVWQKMRLILSYHFSN